MIHFTATYIGIEDEEYQKGERYRLWVTDQNGVCVRKPDGTGFRFYAYLSDFLKDWDCIAQLLQKCLKKE